MEKSKAAKISCFCCKLLYDFTKPLNVDPEKAEVTLDEELLAGLYSEKTSEQNFEKRLHAMKHLMAYLEWFSLNPIQSRTLLNSKFADMLGLFFRKDLN